MSSGKSIWPKFAWLASWLQTLSLQQALNRALLRFPLSILSLLVLTVSWLLIIDFSSRVCCLDGFRLYLFENMYFFFRLAIVSAIGVVLFTAIRLYWETRRDDRNTLLVYYTIGLIILVLVFAIFPWQVQDLASQYLYQAFLLGLVTVSLFLIIPFIYQSNNQGVWSFWYSLGYNFGIAYGFGLIINLSLSTVLVFTSFLFNLSIDPRVYVMLLILAVVTFSTWYFLANLPDGGSQIFSKEVDYPKYLKFLAKYILPFIFVVYLLILYIYSLRIIVTQNWPSNQIALPVIWFVIIGFSTVILLFPLVEEKWAKRLSQIIYGSILPIMLIYFFAVGFRVYEFGWTIGRYLLVIFGLWVVLISLYFLISKKPLLKTWPLSIALILLLFSFGPWGVFAVSQTDQLQRLKEVLESQGLLVNGKIKPTNKVIPCTEEARINNLVEYLVLNHGINTLQDLYNTRDWDEIMQKVGQNNQPKDSEGIYYYSSYPNYNWTATVLVEQMGLRRNFIPDCNGTSITDQNVKKVTFSYQAAGVDSLKVSEITQVVYFQINYFDLVNSSSSTDLVYTITIGDDLELVATKETSTEASEKAYDQNQLDKNFLSTNSTAYGFVGLNLQAKNKPQTAIDLLNLIEQSILNYQTKPVNFQDLAYSDNYLDLREYVGRKPLVLLNQKLIGNQKVTLVLTSLQVDGQYIAFDEQISLQLTRVSEIQGLVLLEKLN